MIAIGCIADDFTGGSDVAAALRRSGLSVALLFDAPDEETVAPEVDAVVIALKTRTVPVEDAVARSLAALAWLRAGDVERVYFKYCSTFDSTDEGNIGPVTDALLDALGEPTTVICPASPEHGRTTYLGHLFVGDRLLSESPMRHHPLTPMTDPDLVRVLQRQTTGVVGALPLSTITEGSGAVMVALKAHAAAGVRHVVADAVRDTDLLAIAEGATDLRLLTGGAGLAGAAGAVAAAGSRTSTPAGELPAGPGVVLAGSCSAATLAQVAAAAEVMPSYRLDPTLTPDPAEMLASATEWLTGHLGESPVLVYSSAGPEERELAKAAMGAETSSILERTLGSLARTATHRGARRIVVAGGETSGAVVQALGVRSVLVDHEADRGVPWCLADEGLALLLKSGNFGTEDLLVRAAGAEA
ncbi:3-oxo-tetronate kinase [Nocardioides sp. NPDC059952]|uniref:3-oxo-tetronate kinase n=1 Tax=Nocardioides sp. NPDC059952 TaxID=3347014 RepID=UPI0036569553